MLYELVIKLFGFAILSTIWFQPLTLNLDSEKLTVRTQLNNPITKEMKQLIEKDLDLTLSYTFTLLINDAEIQTKKISKTISYKRKRFRLNGKRYKFKALQKEVGKLKTTFTLPKTDKVQKLKFLLEAEIQSEPNFESVTKLKTMSLWNYHKPTKKATYYRKGSQLELLNET